MATLVAVLSLRTTISVSTSPRVSAMGGVSSPSTPEPWDLVGFGQDQPFVEGGVAGANLFGGVEQNAHLDDRGRLDGLIGRERGSLAGSQIVCVDGDVAVMRRCNGLNLLIELRRLRAVDGAWARSEAERRANASDKHGQRVRGKEQCMQTE